MASKILLMQCHPDSVNGEGYPVAVFDTFEQAREWLQDEKNLRYAIDPYSYEPTPAIVWEIHNQGALHLGKYERRSGTYTLSLTPVEYMKGE